MTKVKSTSKSGAGWVAEVHHVTHNHVYGEVWRRTDQKFEFKARNAGSFFLVNKGKGVLIRFPIPDMPMEDLKGANDEDVRRTV